MDDLKFKLMEEQKQLEEKINYLAKCGWRIEIEERSGNKYMYAVKYIERKKRRIYLAAESEYKSL